MSALAGIYTWSEGSVDEMDLERLATLSRVAGPDGTGTVRPLPGLILQAHLLHFDRRSARERQPFVLGNGSTLTWDGRLDNRDDLLARLPHELKTDPTDVEIVAASYARWGIDVLGDLVGDWSLALWDASTRTLVLARDVMGNRALYYRVTPAGITWATRLEALAAACHVETTPDDTYVAARLTHGAVPPDVTPFQGLRALKAGHVLQARSASDVRISRYWDFPSGTIRYRDSRDYTEHLRTLLFEAVRVRLRADRTVWAHLSGGWDSSAIVCIAQALIRGGHVEASALRTVSMLSGLRSADIDDIPAIEEWCGLQTCQVSIPGHPHIFIRRPRPTLRPDLSSCYHHHLLHEPIAAAGGRVALSGVMGDLVMMKQSAMPPMLDLLHSGHPIRFLQRCTARAKHVNRSRLPVLLRILQAGYTPRSWRTPHLLRRKGHSDSSFRHVTPQTLTLVPKRPAPRNISHVPYLKRWMAEAIRGVVDSGATCNREIPPDLLVTFPFTHRPLMTFMLAAPALPFCDPIRHREGMRLALGDVLPPVVLARTSTRRGGAFPRAEQGDSISAVIAEDKTLQDPHSWELVQRGYLKSASAHGAVTRLGSPEWPFDVVEEWLRLELWLRTMEAQRRAPIVPSTGATSGASVDTPGRMRSIIASK